MNSEQCADDKLNLGGSHSNITMVAKMYHTILILDSAGGHFELWRPSCIDKYSIVYFRCNSLKLNIYYQAFKSSFYPKKVKLCTFC